VLLEVTSTTTTIQVVRKHKLGGQNQGLSTVEAYVTAPGEWRITRIFVLKPYRGQGLGTHMVRVLVTSVIPQKGFRISVCPGGYGGDLSRQRAFCERLGFKGRVVMVLVG